MKRSNIFDIGHFLTITNRSGAVFSGEFASMAQGNYYIKNVEIMGKRYCVKAPWALLDMQTVAYIFPKNYKLTRLKEERN